MFSVMRQKNFRFLWLAGFISLLGDWVLYAVFPFYIAQSTGSALATGLMSLITLLPSVLLGTIVGVWVDRWQPKIVMIVADISRGGVLLFLLLVPLAQLGWLIYPVALIEASLSVFFSPARAVMFRRVLSDEDLVAANSINSIADNVCRLAGPILGGGLYLLWGLQTLVVIDSISYLFSGLLVIGIILPRIAPKKDVSETKQPVVKTSFLRQWQEGFQWIGRARWLVVLCGCMALAMLGQGILNALLPLFAENTVKMDAEVYGWYLSAQGIGGLLGGFLFGKFGKILRPIDLLLTCLGITGILLIFQVNVPLIPVVLIIALLMGIFVVGWMIGLQTILQLGVDPAYLGRIIGTYGTAQMLALLLGTSGGSLIGGGWGVVPALNIAATCLLIACIACLFFRESFLGEKITLHKASLIKSSPDPQGGA